MADFLDSLKPPSANHSRSMPVREDCWSEEATSTLIDAWGRCYLELNCGNLRQKDWHWQDVADAVNAFRGHTKKMHRTDAQCKNRIDTIKKKSKIEKRRIFSSNGALWSSWALFELLDVLIGSKFNVKKSSPSPAVSLPLSYTKVPSLPTPVLAKAVALAQKRLAASVMDDSYFRRNYSAVAAAAAAEVDEDEGEEEVEIEDEKRQSEVGGGGRG